MLDIPLFFKNFFETFIRYRRNRLKMGKLVKLKNIKLGQHNYFSSNTNLANVVVGDYTYTGANTVIRNAVIGKFCSIADNVKIGLGFHPVHFISTHPSFFSNNKKFKCFSNKVLVEEYKSTTVGNDVWIGSNVMIFGGITIGDGSVIAGGAIVTKDVAPYTIVGGNPAKVIKPRFDEKTIEKLLTFKWWEKDLAWVELNYDRFNSPEEFLKFIDSN